MILGAVLRCLSQVRSHFRPEFVNRIDEFIIFDPLRQEQIERIVRMQVGSVKRVWERAAAGWREQAAMRSRRGR